MKPRPFALGAVSLCLLWPLLLGGCAGDGAGAGGARIALPGALGARWTPPENATRTVDGERVVVLDACVATASALGFGVTRFDGASGVIIAARRQSTDFDGARQDTLEIKVSSFAPGLAQVTLVLRETVEGGAGGVSVGMVRDPARYDVFFERLAGVLGGSLSP